MKTSQISLFILQGLALFSGYNYTEYPTQVTTGDWIVIVPPRRQLEKGLELESPWVAKVTSSGKGVKSNLALFHMDRCPELGVFSVQQSKFTLRQNEIGERILAKFCWEGEWPVELGRLISKKWEGLISSSS